MNAQHRPHARIKSRLFVALAQALSARNGSLEAFAEASIEAPPSSAPEPDIVVTDEPDGEGLIPIASVKLVVEVADTTLATDVGRKARFYASQSVPEYWVVDVAGRQIHQMWKPEAAAYAEHRAVAFGEPIEAATVLDLAIETAGLS